MHSSGSIPMLTIHNQSIAKTNTIICQIYRLTKNENIESPFDTHTHHPQPNVNAHTHIRLAGPPTAYLVVVNCDAQIKPFVTMRQIFEMCTKQRESESGRKLTSRRQQSSHALCAATTEMRCTYTCTLRLFHHDTPTQSIP